MGKEIYGLGLMASNKYLTNSEWTQRAQDALEKWHPLEGTHFPSQHAGSTGSEANQRVSGNGLNHHVELFIDYLNSLSKTY